MLQICGLRQEGPAALAPRAAPVNGREPMTLRRVRSSIGACGVVSGIRWLISAARRGAATPALHGRSARGLIVLSFSSALLGQLSGCAGYVGYTLDCINDASNYEAPDILEGHFPYRLVYSVDGQLGEVEDTLRCTYSGRECNWTGHQSTWKQESTQAIEEITLKQIDADTRLTFLPLYCSSFVDRASGGEYEPYTPHLVLVRERNDETRTTILDPEEAEKIYGATIVGWEALAPELRLR